MALMPFNFVNNHYSSLSIGIYVVIVLMCIVYFINGGIKWIVFIFIAALVLPGIKLGEKFSTTQPVTPTGFGF
jgi:hypothetical protein